MLDALCVDLRRRIIDAEGAQKREHNFVATLCFARECAAFDRESKRRVCARINKAFACESTHDATHGDMRESKALGDAANARFDSGGQEIGDRFAVILCGLAFMLFAQRAVMRGGCQRVERDNARVLHTL